MMYMIQGHPSEQSYPICQKIANRQELPAGLPEKREVVLLRSVR